MKKQIRPLGQILLDIEPYLLEIADHDLQFGDFEALLFKYLDVHLKHLEEEYEDDTKPIRFYGHRDDFIAEAERLKRVLKRDKL